MLGVLSVFHIDTMQENERMSTQDLLLAIEEAVKNGETEFEIAASGQHDIGGPLWHPEGKTLTFHVTNAGQRLGSMCLPHTKIIAAGSVSADVGWLNSGGSIIVKGDAGDTAGHCASGGQIYIGGRGGTRTGSLMKHDPLYEAPELWVLKSVGSFSFEFMGGGRAVVCGADTAKELSVLGERPCVGMVGGTVYARGNLPKLPADVGAFALEAEDIEFLAGGMADFLAAVERPELQTELTVWSEWHKLRPLTAAERQGAARGSVSDFRRQDWIKGGLFSDVANDDFAVLNTVNTGLYRLRVPAWDNGKFAAPCEFSCPVGIPTQKRYALLREGKTDEAKKLVLKYTPFPGSVCGTLCPNPCMDGCTRSRVDRAIQIGALGLSSATEKLPTIAAATGKKIAVIGGGAAGLSAAWQLAQKGHTVTVYDEAAHLGGKMELVIPRGRLPHELLTAELQRIEAIGVKFVADTKVDSEKFKALREENDAVIIAIGGHKARFFAWEGLEHLTYGIDYLKRLNRGEKPLTGRHVVVIGCGNSGMDTCRGVYEMGAESVVAVDVQKPAAFAHEIAHFESLGGKIVWPFVTQKLTAEGIYANDGRFIPADQIIVSIGEEPVIDFLAGWEVKTFRGAWLVTDKTQAILPGVFAAGDVLKPGRLTDAIGSGKQAAWHADRYVCGKDFLPYPQKDKVPAANLSIAWFEKYHPDQIGEPCDDKKRCVSCGTCRDCKMCLESCPEKAISRHEKPDGSWEYVSDPDRCIGCGICAGVCPCGVWELQDNTEEIKMYSTGQQIGA